MRKFIGLVGTNTTQSTNRQLLQFMKRHFVKQAELELIEVSGLPMFNKPQDMKVPERATEIAKKIDASDGVIISTPEYDHAVPAVLMNALEWLSYGIHPLLDKPVMIIGASFGSLGTSRAQAHLRQMLDSPEISARVMPSSEYLVGHVLEAFDDKGDLTDKDKVEQLDALFADFQQFVEISKELWHTVKVDKKEVQKLGKEDFN
ncbi:NADPH-dependent FMN reductase [Lentilactobacillus hilgardii]|uniref:Flavin reductase n=1 Tax=Lentilactobacillus hilgardii (strain ATCC 8290 / DSM 20176 / CCUG 30140 / JCM 1155 / KCTC 3500 / NBRC 15886 / NCIMB 8040 / NRRL B-1843 / 9) TaxID=1423757 RepID=C0XFQ7_LENH9|nr:NADPH-dependent FMN reductase [Lentilactobacillus hilgardii]EEI25809.1 flavin reductase [Lentilactobacillus hilgardii DSM 20176 = ATCC 8290]KRK56598.1 NAD(P)H dehydrogenase (quinone) [Lentilactobacillus hilgardii DSM 20176 = ATCC 8290]MCP9332454.1 NAD(P)H-dependent oxidoreductase [Lentilactobacillus hilgardii]MCP9349061.1 NAD(P)H-dependent oxidoreductase [Lentilactobacillus hilgardii]MCP9351972.1 NAD(P)H-dependent oxidoreductase [Lentilactobacillus hilgardii]